MVVPQPIVRRAFLMVTAGAAAFVGCGGGGAVEAAGGGGAAGGATSATAASGGGGGSASAATSGSASTATSPSSSNTGTPEACGCLLGEGPYCAARALAEAEAAGCALPEAEAHPGDLLKCVGDTWSVLEACSGKCSYTAGSTDLDDECQLPVCDCFVAVAWCGSGAAKEAAAMGCRIPLLPEHDGDILYCPEGKWGVKQACPTGCVEAPKGTPDYCKSKSDYRIPFDCNSSNTCTNGNHTSTHTGKDAYAFDFGVPSGTTVRAMRAGTVRAVRLVSKPGDPCYENGGTSCANFANTVEVKHSDGTIGLYMHLSTASVSKGDPVAQGAVLGKSGNSGWSTGPHLHVQVQNDCGIWWCQSLPFKFVEDATVSKGTVVKSDNCP